MTLDGILQRLEQDGSEWAANTFEQLRRLPTLPLKIAIQAYRIGSKLNARQCLAMEYRATSHYLSGAGSKYFNEGNTRNDSRTEPRWMSNV